MYVDGFVLPVPKRNYEKYRAMARKAGKVKNRGHRDRVNAKVMKDKRITSMMDPKKFPFDGKRMFWGGFRVAVDL